jgi:hypothetical protein
MPNRRKFLLSAGASLAAVGTLGTSLAQQVVVGGGGVISSGGILAPARKYIGVNLSGLKYWTPEQPFLNLFKSASANSGEDYWFIQGTSYSPFLLLDSDGYVTSMVDSQGTTNTQIFCFINNAVNGGTLPPNCSQLYQTGTFRLQFSGPGTFFVGFDCTIPAQTPPTGVTISGNSVTSTLTNSQTASITVQVTSATSAGISWGVTSLPNDGVNYIRNLSLVPTAYTALYDAGQIFHPQFLAKLTPYSRLRFMDWMATNFQEYGLNFSATLANGATSGTLATAWTRPTGTYTFVFANGQIVPSVSLTYNSTAANWAVGDALTSAISATSIIGWMASWVKCPTWASRPQMSNFSWGLAGKTCSKPGVPYEVQILLCNQLRTDAWLNIPVGANYCDPTFTPSLAALVRDGTGASLAGPVTVFPGLSSAKKAWPELGNEVWNFGTFGYGQSGFAEMVGQQWIGLPGGNYNQFFATMEQYGIWVAGIGDAFASAFGSAMSSRIRISMGTQTVTGNGPAYLAASMNTLDWTSRAYTHHVTDCHVAPYMQLLSKASAATTAQYQTDIGTIAALADPVGETFSLSYSNVGVSGNTYTSLPTIGYVRGTVTSIANLQTIIADIRGNGFAWGPTVTIQAYEMGEDTVTATSNWGFALSTPEIQMLENSYHDPRMQYLYHDPGHVLSSNPGYLDDIASSGVTPNLFNDIETATNNSQWALFGDSGQYENVWQPTAPAITAPGKALGVYNYVNF